jgi:hypothetical protein
MDKRMVVKNDHGSGYLIDDGTGFSIRYATKADALRQIARMERSEAEEIAARAERMVVRLALAREYLAIRAWRKAEAAKQASFDF